MKNNSDFIQYFFIDPLDLIIVIVLIFFIRKLLINFLEYKAYNNSDNYHFQIKIYHLLTFIRPFSAENYNNLGSTYATYDNWALAIKNYERAIRINPGFAEAYTNMGIGFHELGELKKAISCHKKAIDLKPFYPDSYTNLGLVYTELGDINLALRNLEKGYRLKRGIPFNVEPLDGVALQQKIGLHKLFHDLEQLEYLIKENLLPESFNSVLENYQEIYYENLSNRDLFKNLPPQQWSKIKGYYDRNIYFEAAPSLSEPVINNYLDIEAIQNDYKTKNNLFFDNFLSQNALEELRKFCLRNTIWHDYRKTRGYIGSYLDDGFYCPLLFQIAEELKTKFPEIFHDLPLTYMWAYKYGSFSKGFKVHADRATINVNFWITPDEANLEPKHGGMIVYQPEHQIDWNFDNYNVKTSDIQSILEKHNCKPIEIPYRQNRVVLFNSSLFHETAPFKFKEGYENHRINITMLFGNKILI